MYSSPKINKKYIKIKEFVTSTNFLIIVMFILSFVCGGVVSFIIFGNTNTTKDIYFCTTTTTLAPTVPTTFDYSDLKPLNLPIKRIIVGHTNEYEGGYCFNKTQCLQKIQQIKDDNPEIKHILWNYMIGGDGDIYEGRGYRYEGEHTMDIYASSYNEIGIGIGFIGNFCNLKPSTEMINALKRLIRLLIHDGVLESDHLIFFQDDLVYKENDAISLKSSLKEVENFYERKKCIFDQNFFLKI